MSNIDKIFKEIVTLDSQEKLRLIDKVLSTMYPVNKGAEEIWKNEADARVEAQKNDQISAIPEDEIFDKYKR